MIARWQESVPDVPDYRVTNQDFFGWHTFLLIALPFVLLALVAWRRARVQRGKTEQFDQGNFAARVLQSPMPVLVHFYRAWGVADQVIIAQVEMLAKANEGRLRVGWVDMDTCPDLVKMLDPLESPCVVLFKDGRKVYQRGGLFAHQDLQRDLDAVLTGRPASGRGP